MTEWIIIIGLVIVCISITGYGILMSKKYSKDLDDILADCDRLLNEYEKATDKITELNNNLASSLDAHERAFNELYISKKKLELELNEKNAEIERLNVVLNYSKNDVVTLSQFFKDDSEEKNGN